MATKLKKGVEVYRICDWNGKAKVCIQKLTLKAYGKKVALAVNAKDGQFIEERIYAETTHGGYADLYAVADVENVEAFALQLAVAQKAERVTQLAERIARCGAEDARYVAALEKNLVELEADAPGFVYR